MEGFIVVWERATSPKPPRGTAPRDVGGDLLTVSEAATLLRVSRRTLERMVARGQLAFISLPLLRGGLRFRRSEIEQFLEKHHREKLG